MQHECGQIEGDGDAVALEPEVLRQQGHQAAADQPGTHEQREANRHLNPDQHTASATPRVRLQLSGPEPVRRVRA
jgi:hypothetical protein